MPVDFVSAITAEAHRFGLPVFAHPSDAAGLRAAVDGGVDILAHAEEVPGTVDADTLGKMMRQNMALIPTLKLFAEDDTLPNILQQVKSYSERGGEILFGTDAGFLKDYDPSGEYQLLARAGLSFRQILAALTTAPAHRFGFSGRKGRLEAQMDGDIVLLAADPADSPASFAGVRYCIRGGRVLFSSTGH
jgi:imidazolonepropionase-like amidohydrolase